MSGRKSTLLGIGALIGLVLSTLAGPANAQNTEIIVDTVALSGAVAPGTGLPFLFFPSAPTLDASGEVLFVGYLGTDPDSDDNGIWTGTTGSLDLVARTGDTHPDAGAPFLWLDARAPILNLSTAANTLAFPGFFGTSGTIGDEGLWLGPLGATRLIARTGSVAPGTGNVDFVKLVVHCCAFPSQPTDLNEPPQPELLLLNDNGAVAFTGILGTSQPDGMPDHGIWAGAGLAGSAIGLVTRTGEDAPDVPGSVFRIIHTPVMSDQGAFAFIATIKDTATGDELPGIWHGPPGNLANAVLAGDLAPDTGGRTFAAFLSVDMNADEKLAFLARLNFTGDFGEGIWTGMAGSPSLVARSGDDAPGLFLRTFRNFDSPVVLNASGEVAFAASLDLSDLTNKDGLWFGGPGNLTLVARQGDPAPGTGENFLGTFMSPALNTMGDLAFVASLPAGNGGEALSIWIRRNGELNLMVREGGPLEVAPGDVRTVFELSFRGDTGNQDGRPSGFSDAGEVAFVARFVDNTSGIFIARVNQFPVADAGADFAVNFKKGKTTTVTLDGSGSDDPDGTIVSYVWTEGGSQVATGAMPELTLGKGVFNFTLTVTDDHGATASDGVIVTVTKGSGGGGNSAPVAIDDSVTTTEGVAVTIDVLANDTDSDGDTLTVSSTTQGQNGSVVVNADDTVTYTPNGNFTGIDSFTYTANDGTADSNSATVTVEVQPIGGGFSLTATGYKVKGLQKADLEWQGATGSNVDIFRDGVKIATTANDGFHTDDIDQRGGGSYGYRVCEENDAAACSSPVTVTF